MSFKELLSDHSTRVFLNSDRFGEEAGSVQYLPPNDGEPVTIENAAFEEDEQEEAEAIQIINQQGTKMPRWGTLWIPAETSIVRQGRFTIRGETWNILGIPGAEAGLIPVKVMKPGTSTISRIDNKK